MKSCGDLQTNDGPVKSSRSDAPVACAPDAREQGALLQEFRSYLLAIANAEVSSDLAGGIAPSDLVQETLICGLNRFGTFRGATRAELARWLRRILQNRLALARRTSPPQQSHDFSPTRRDVQNRISTQPSPSAAAMSREAREHLDQALDRLPDDQRQAILLRHQDDLTFREIGEQLQRSEEAARKLWARAILRLQREMAHDDCRSPPVIERSSGRFFAD